MADRCSTSPKEHHYDTEENR